MTVSEQSTLPITETQPVARTRPWLPDLLGVAWVILAAAAVMAPALSHGWSLGPFDQLSQLGLTQRAQPLPHNSQVFDLIREIIPWTTLSWTQVHSGLLPLWNPYSALGAPLAFNWQSATFSLPALVGYLVPVRLDFTVQVLITLLVAGTGMYVLGRVMRLGVLGAAMAATVFELSGSFISVLGWPIAAVLSWSGWLFALMILVVRGRRRRRDITLFAVVARAVDLRGRARHPGRGHCGARRVPHRHVRSSHAPLRRARTDLTTTAGCRNRVGCRPGPRSAPHPPSGAVVVGCRP